MSHKARRRPSWKKRKSKYFDRLKNELVDRLALEIRKEIDKEILRCLSGTVTHGTANPREPSSTLGGTSNIWSVSSAE